MMYKLLILQLLAHLVSDFYLQTEKSEYVLVGTLLSFGMAILVGVGVKLLIESNVIS